MRKALSYFLLFTLILCLKKNSAQAQLIEVWRDTTYTAVQFLERAIAEYSDKIKDSEYNTARRIASRFGRTTRIVSIKYRTTGPDGQPLTASGVVAYPVEGEIRGVVEVAPVCKDKSSCGSVQMFATEFAPAVVGYVTIAPDMLGFGATADMPVSYFDHKTAVTLSVDMRRAAAEYLHGIGIELPASSDLFGYSLGAANAFALACHYSAYPWLGVKVSSLFIGGGAYSPVTAVRSYAASGRMDYVILPGIIESIRHYRHLDIDISRIFKGNVLRDFKDIVSARLNGTDLCDKYGSNLREYMCDDFFRAEGNAVLNAVIDVLKTEVQPHLGQRLDPNIFVSICHARGDSIVPVSCSDELYDALRPLQKNLSYHRDNNDSHHSEGARLFYSFLKYLIF